MIIRSVLKWMFVGFFFLFFITPSTFDLLKEKWVISRALANAKSVRLEHYRNYIDTGGSEAIIAAKNLDPKDFHRVGAAFPFFLDVGFPGLELKCIFNPHHRIVITDASGNVTVIRVCFECDQLEIAKGDQKYGDIEGTPFIWMHTLRRFFAEEGMPNSPEFYRRSYPDVRETNQAPAINK